jgi:hypothetical protein
MLILMLCWKLDGVGTGIVGVVGVVAKDGTVEVCAANRWVVLGQC